MINEEEARKLTDGQRKSVKEHIYTQIEKYAKSGLSEVGISLYRYSCSSEDIELLKKELTFKGFKVTEVDDGFQDAHLLIKW